MRTLLSIPILLSLCAIPLTTYAAETNSRPEGNIGIAIQNVRVSVAQHHAEWQVALTNYEGHLILVSEAAVKKMLLAAKLKDHHGDTWQAGSTNQDWSVSTQNDHDMFIRAKKSFENTVETRWIEAQSTNQLEKPDALDYKFDTTILVTDPRSRKDVVYRCSGAGKVSIDWRP